MATNLGNHVAGFTLWACSLVLFAAGAWLADEKRADAGARWRTDAGPGLSPGEEAMALLLILGIAVVLCFVLLDEVPRFVDADEARHGRYAEEMWRLGFPDMFGLGWNVFPHLSYAVGYIGIRLLGTGMWQLRLSYAFVGVLSLLPLFFFAKRWWGNVVALLATAMLAINFDHIYFSRVALNNIHQVFIAALVLAAFARVLDERRPIDWVGLGYAVGFGFHTYHAAKLFPALVALPLVFFVIGVPGFVRRHALACFHGVLAFILSLGPLIYATWWDWERFYASTADRSDFFLLTTAYTRGDIAGVRSYIFGHVVGTLYSLISLPSAWALLDFIPSAIFLTGILWVIWEWRDPRHLVLLAWIGGTLVVGGMMTWHPPSIPRLVGILPALCVVIALVIGRFRGLAFRCLPRRADMLVMPILLAGLSITLYRGWHSMFVFWQTSSAYNPIAAVCTLLEGVPLPVRIYVAGIQPMDASGALSHCMVRLDVERTVTSLADDANIVPLPPTHRGNALLLVMQDQTALASMVSHYYPGARKGTLQENALVAPSFQWFDLAESLINERRGLNILTDAAVVQPVEALQNQRPGGRRRAAAMTIGSGLVWIPLPGPYRFRVDPRGSVYIDNRSLSRRDQSSRAVSVPRQRRTRMVCSPERPGRTFSTALPTGRPFVASIVAHTGRSVGRLRSVYSCTVGGRWRTCCETLTQVKRFNPLPVRQAFLPRGHDVECGQGVGCADHANGHLGACLDTEVQ